MKKTKFTTINLFAFALTFLFVLCSCYRNESTRKESLPIKDDIIKAYDIDAEGEALIADLFAKFDSALVRLQKESNVSDDDFLEYVGAVAEAFSDFDETFSEKYGTKLEEKKNDPENKDDQVDAALIGMGYSTSALKFSLLNTSKFLVEAGMDDTSGESLVENAVKAINDLSVFFYDKEIITDDDLDAIR